MHSTSGSPTLRKLRGVPEKLPELGAEAHESCKGRREKMKCYQGQGTWYTFLWGRHLCSPRSPVSPAASFLFPPPPRLSRSRPAGEPPACPSFLHTKRQKDPGHRPCFGGESKRVSYLPRVPLKSFTTASPSPDPLRPGSVGVALGAQPICPSPSFGSAFQAVRTFHISFFNTTLFPQTQIPGTLS